MNMDNSSKYLILTIFCVIIFFIMENYKKDLKNEMKDDLIDNFENLYSNSIFEDSLYKKYSNIDKKYICNLLPYLSSSEFGCNNEKIIPTPKHIIKLSGKSGGKYLGVFNDGNIYEKSRIRDKFWKGSLSNSMPNNKYLRMITLDSKENLLGITHDGELYIKYVNENNKRNRYDKQWNKLPGLTIPLIYIINEMKIIDNSGNIINKSENDILIGLDYSGLIIKMEYDPELGILSNDRLANDITPVLKLYYDKNGYLLGLNKDLHIIRKKTINYDESEFDETKFNPNEVIDIIYDNDGKMFGLVPIVQSSNTNNFNTLMKQNLVNYQSKFLPLDLTDINSNSTNDNVNSVVLNDNDIIKLKTGVNFEIESEIKSTDYGYNNINEAIERTNIEDLSDLRKLCADRTFPDDSVEYANFELLNRMEVQQSKIDELNDILFKLKEIGFVDNNSNGRVKLQ